MPEVVGVGRTAEVLAGAKGTVVKLYYEWVPTRFIDAEEAGTAAAFAAGAPAPRLLARVKQDGRDGLVFERLDGESMLAALVANPSQAPALAVRLAQVQAEIQGCSGDGLPSFREQLRSRIESVSQMSARARDWSLRRLMALPDGDGALHGDLHPGNVILATRGDVAIDWMAAARGDAAADAARTALILELGPPPEVSSATGEALSTTARGAFGARWLDSYLRITGVHRADVTAWRPVIAAARLFEDIDDERSALCDIVDAAMA